MGTAEQQDAVKFPNARMRLVGEDGNAYSIMGRAQQALRRAGATPEQVKQYLAEAMSGDYDNLLRTTMAWCACDEAAGYEPHDDDDYDDD